ncbi:APC family permease [Streptomyces sp900105245]|uniref:APC family permease n=1 Tax=Streptomyces sp. 900105245 TaxID=3154379 RepID=A0ABV1UMF3_9ACTN
MKKESKEEKRDSLSLRRNALGLGGAVVMSAAIMGPAVSTFFNPQFSMPFSGAATPLVYVLCLVAILITASGIMEMAAKLPSAGAFYTYVTQGIGPKSGFVTGGLTFVAYALLPPAEIGLVGSYLQNTLRDEVGIALPWWLIGLAPAGLMIFLALEGVQSSLRTALVLFTVEVIVVVTLAIIIVMHGGRDGLSVQPLTPGASPHGVNGLVTGFIFAALSFVGFEAATTLSEEVRKPTRNVPKAIGFSVLFVGALYVFCVWAEVIGLGAGNANRIDGSSTPWNDLATSYAPWAKLLVVFAATSSMFAVMVNSNTGVVRILHVMGREGMLPRLFAYVDPKRKTPTYTVLAQGLFSVVIALLVGAFSGGLTNPTGGSNVYGYLGFLLTLGILPVYVLTNIATIRFFVKRGSFHLVRHGVLPILAILLMVGLLVGQIQQQTTAPYTWFPWLIAGWVAVVTAGAIWLSKHRPNKLAVAGAVMATGETENEIALSSDGVNPPK